MSANLENDGAWKFTPISYHPDDFHPGKDITLDDLARLDEYIKYVSEFYGIPSNKLRLAAVMLRQKEQELGGADSPIRN